MVLAPLIRDRKGEYLKVFEDVRKAGFVRVRDPKTVLIPDRRGNNRVDTLRSSRRDAVKSRSASPSLNAMCS